MANLDRLSSVIARIITTPEPVRLIERPRDPDKSGREFTVFKICVAYEQGYGVGLEAKEQENPYTLESDLYQAWDYGFAEGQKACAQAWREQDDHK